ncbi:MAG TPA: hypothetical protein VGL72_13570, partial [Bryobacteraceae bacterium]
MAGLEARFPRVAPLAAVMRAIGLASYRELRTFQSITGQNFFYLVLLIGLQPESAAFFGVIIGALLFFPLSSDPLEKVPPDRRKLWPLGNSDWLALRIASLFLSPVIWIALFVLFRIGWRLAVQLALVGLAAHGVSFAVKKWIPQFNLMRLVPAPPGVTGQIMRLHWREMLTTLDPYVGLLLTVATTLYRIGGYQIDAAALPVISMVVVVAISTSAQVLIGIDGPGAQRYRLMPLDGWQILLAKDLAFLAVMLILIAPMEVPASFTAGLAALTIGHSRAVEPSVSQQRWRFTSGVMWPTGAFQMFAIFAIGNGVLKYGAVFIAGTVAAWLISLWW